MIPEYHRSKVSARLPAAVALLTVHIADVEECAKDRVDLALAEHAPIAQWLQVAAADLLNDLYVAAFTSLQGERG